MTCTRPESSDITFRLWQEHTSGCDRWDQGGLQDEKHAVSFCCDPLSSLRRTYVQQFPGFPYTHRILMVESDTFHYTQANFETSFISCRSKLMGLIALILISWIFLCGWNNWAGRAVKLSGWRSTPCVTLTVRRPEAASLKEGPLTSKPAGIHQKNQERVRHVVAKLYDDHLPRQWVSQPWGRPTCLE